MPPVDGAGIFYLPGAAGAELPWGGRGLEWPGGPLGGESVWFNSELYPEVTAAVALPFDDPFAREAAAVLALVSSSSVAAAGGASAAAADAERVAAEAVPAGLASEIAVATFRMASEIAVRVDVAARLAEAAVVVAAEEAGEAADWGAVEAMPEASAPGHPRCYPSAGAEATAEVAVVAVTVALAATRADAVAAGGVPLAAGGGPGDDGRRVSPDGPGSPMLMSPDPSESYSESETSGIEELWVPSAPIVTAPRTANCYATGAGAAAAGAGQAVFLSPDGGDVAKGPLEDADSRTDLNEGMGATTMAAWFGYC